MRMPLPRSVNSPIARSLSVASGSRDIGREHEVGVGLLPTTSHTTLELIELRQAQALGVLDDECVGMGVVNAALDDGRGHEHVNLAGHELLHDVFDLVGGHLAMRHTHASLGRHAQHALHGLVDGFHAVRHVVDLPATSKFQAHGRTHDILVPLAHMYLHGDTPSRRRLDERHVAHAAHGHLHRAGDGRCRKGQHVNLLAQVLEVLLVLHAKALLLIDDDQAPGRVG